MNKKQLLIILALVTLIPAVILTYFFINQARERILANAIAQYQELQSNLGQQTAKLLETRIQNLYDKLQAIAQIPEVRSGSTEPCNIKLTEVASTLAEPINNLGRIGSDGKFTCSVNRALVGVNGASLGSYVTEIFNDPQHRPILSRRIQVPNVDGYLVALHIPVFNTAGEFSGTLGGAVYFNDLAAKYFQDINFAREGYVTLSDDNGDVLHHPLKPLNGINLSDAAFQQRINFDRNFNEQLKLAEAGEIQYVRYNLDEREKTAVFVPVKIFADRYWVVNVTVPIEDLRQGISATEVELLFNALVIIVVGFILFTPLLLLSFLIFQVFRPIDKIIAAMAKVSEGNLEEQVVYRGNSTRDEISQLATAFNNMVKTLKRSYSILEERVQQRTADLASAKSNLEEEVTARTHELVAAKQGLENKVQQRTEELQKKMEELERFNSLAVGRELKMVQLKDEIAQLKKETDFTNT